MYSGYPADHPSAHFPVDKSVLVAEHGAHVAAFLLEESYVLLPCLCMFILAVVLRLVVACHQIEMQAPWNLCQQRLWCLQAAMPWARPKVFQCTLPIRSCPLVLRFLPPRSVSSLLAVMTRPCSQPLPHPTIKLQRRLLCTVNTGCCYHGVCAVFIRSPLPSPLCVVGWGLWPAVMYV